MRALWLYLDEFCRKWCRGEDREVDLYGNASATKMRGIDKRERLLYFVF